MYCRPFAYSPSNNETISYHTSAAQATGQVKGRLGVGLHVASYSSEESPTFRRVGATGGLVCYPFGARIRGAHGLVFIWLVVWNIFYFPYIRKNHPN
jgi:hypothetical protein